jgi:HEPN domain-containing protein
VTDTDYIGAWFLKARQDLKIIEQGMDRPETEWVSELLCFHAQQAAEKALKAFLIAKSEEPPRTHSIEVLLERCRLSDSSFPEYEIRNLPIFRWRSAIQMNPTNPMPRRRDTMLNWPDILSQTCVA